MTSEKINELSEKFGKYVSKNQLMNLQNKLENADEKAFDEIKQIKLKSSFVTTMLSAFLGLFGAGSFYLGRIKAGILKVVFNVIVPLTALILFLVWLAPANKLYYDQSFDVARSVYSIIGTEEEYEGYNRHIFVVTPWRIDRADNFKNGLDEIKKLCNTVTSAEEIQINDLKDATAVKTVLDGMDFQEVLVGNENKMVSVRIDFGILPEFKVSELDGIDAKFTAINEKASGLIEQIDSKMPVGADKDLTAKEKELFFCSKPLTTDFYFDKITNVINNGCYFLRGEKLPAKKLITKENILNAAVDIVRERGIEALNMRTLAKRCNCSTQPIYLSFSGIDELKEELLLVIGDIFDKRIEREIASGKYPEYKAVGMGYIAFAREDKQLFKYLLMRNRSTESDWEKTSFDKSTLMIMKNFGLYKDDAAKLHAEMWLFVHGIATMLATDYLNWNEQSISEMITEVFKGLTKI